MNSLAMIGSYIQWGLALGTVIITFRVMYIIYNMSFSFDESISFSAILVKVGKPVKAAIFMVVIVAIIELIKSYLFH